METASRRWVKPELAAITRSRPEEAVLNGCKGVMFVSGDSTEDTNCRWENLGCVNCSGLFAS